MSAFAPTSVDTLMQLRKGDAVAATGLLEPNR